MSFSPELAETAVAEHPRRRLHPRYALRSLAYVKLEQANGGIIRDLTESGVAIQAVAPLTPAQELTLRFDLLSPRVRVEARGRVVWSDLNGQGGIEFMGLPARTQRALRDWLFTQIFSAAASSGRDSIFCDYGQQLMISGTQPAIVLESEGLFIQKDFGDDAPRLQWGIVSLSAHGLAIFVDTLVLLCAVLLFSICSVAAMGGVPAWPLAAALCVTSTTIFIAIYQLLFSDLLCGASPGKRLAALAMQSQPADPAPRFR